jgi:nucleotide-binding universal stress UspA family protein
MRSDIPQLSYHCGRSPTHSPQTPVELLTGNQAGITSTQSTIYGEDVVNELKQYADAKQIDMMVFVSKHRNFWANITHKSVTQNMALSSVIPLLVMHLDDGE